MNNRDRAATPNLYGAFGGLDDLSLEGPLFWPDLPAEDVAVEWAELRAWVHRLVARYDLDSHVVPSCWYRHNHLVEALAALRDHERGSFAATAPPAAAVEWQRAWRDVEGRLRAWTAELRCDNRHHPSRDVVRLMNEDKWEDWLAITRSARDGVGVGEPDPGS